MLRDDTVGDRKTQACATSHWLGRKEWIENARQHLGGNSFAVVSNSDPNFIAGAAGADGDHSMFFDRLARVHEDIHKHLIEFRRQAFDRRQLAESLDYLYLIFEFVPDNVQRRFEPPM